MDQIVYSGAQLGSVQLEKDKVALTTSIEEVAAGVDAASQRCHQVKI